MCKKSLAWKGCGGNCVLHRCGVSEHHIFLYLKENQTKQIKHGKFGFYLYHPCAQPGGGCPAIPRPREWGWLGWILLSESRDGRIREQGRHLYHRCSMVYALTHAQVSPAQELPHPWQGKERAGINPQIKSWFAAIQVWQLDSSTSSQRLLRWRVGEHCGGLCVSWEGRAEPAVLPHLSEFLICTARVCWNS